MSWAANVLLDPFQYAFMVSAFEAGTLVAIAAGLVGWFVVLRRQAFASHTLAAVGFPGASGAALLGLAPWLGYFGFSVAAAVVIALASRRRVASLNASSEESAVIGTVLALTLSFGYLFVSLYKGSIQGISALLFGNFLGVTQAQVQALGVATVVVVAVLAAVSRQLLFASVDPEVAQAAGVPVGRLGVLFLVLLGVSAAEASQITGVLLMFSLLVLPAASAQALTTRPSVSLAVSVLLGVAITWLGLLVAYYTSYPIGFCITSLGFAAFVLAQTKRWSETRATRGRRKQLRIAPAAG